MKPMKNGLTPVLRCANHYNHPEQCRHNHYIHYDVLYEEILKRVRNIAKRLESGELLRSIRRQTARQTRTDKLETERNRITKRLLTLKKIIKKLYEDYAGDMLDADSYHEMLGEYTREQKRINERLVMVENELAKKENQETNVEKLKEVIGGYLQITELNANMLNRLIERIEVSHTVDVDGCKQQEINILYRFIGAAD